MKTNVEPFSNKRVNFLKKIVSLLLKNTILTIKSFAYTPYYFVYIFLCILAFFCSIEESYIHLVSKGFISYIFFTTFLFSLLLNFSFTRKKIECFLGKTFLEKNLPGFYKGFWPLSLFLTTLAFLDLIEALSINSRISEYQNTLNLLGQRIESLNLKGNVLTFTTDVTGLCLKISEIPSFCPSVGILTEFSSYICNFF